jgi:hypothetical protein
MPVLVQIPDNPNCQAVDGQVFQCRTSARPVTHVCWEREGANEWCAITGIDAAGNPCPATACIIEDSGEGECYLVTGGAWGVRLMRPSCNGSWAFHDPEQWGEPFLLLGGDGADLRFRD